MFKLVIEVCFKDYFGLIEAIVLPLESTKSVYFFGTPGISLKHMHKCYSTKR